MFKKGQNKKVISPNISAIEKGNDTELEVDSMLRGLDEDGLLEEDHSAGSEDEEDADDDPELLADLERRQEEIVEQFMEIAFAHKHEVVEELKASFKGNKDVSKEE